MRVELLDITDTPLQRIGKYAAICYNSSQDPESCSKRALACRDKGHLATLRFAFATFHISGISRICSHQLVRSKHLDFLQRSQRYCKEDKADFVYPPSSPDNATLLHAHYKKCQELYTQLLADGMKKEDARFVLPEGTTTELVVTGNFQAWLDFINLRADTHAQWESREVAKRINNTLSQEVPGLFNWIP